MHGSGVRLDHPSRSILAGAETRLNDQVTIVAKATTSISCIKSYCLDVRMAFAVYRTRHKSLRSWSASGRNLRGVFRFRVRQFLTNTTTNRVTPHASMVDFGATSPYTPVFDVSTVRMLLQITNVGTVKNCRIPQKTGSEDQIFIEKFPYCHLRSGDVGKECRYTMIS